MKRFTCLVLLAALFSPQAAAAPKPLTVKKLEVLTAAPAAEGLVISGRNLVTYANTASPNSNIVLNAYNSQGVSQWVRTIDSGNEEIATAAAVDALGSIWLAGSSSQPSGSESATVISAVENPDAVPTDPVAQVRPDLNQITLWKVNPLGDVVATYTVAQTLPALVTGISLNSSGISLIGQLADKPFVVNASLQGVFGKLIPIASAKTTFNAVVRSADGSVNIFGSSAEALAGKKLVGTIDGVLMKVSKSGAIASVVRSSAPKAQRTWLSADPSLALTGSVKTGKVVETAFTKFTSTFAPTWTIRFPSTGKSAVVSGAGITYGAFSSNASIKSISGWKPTAPTLLVTTFDTKGTLTGAYSTPELTVPISLVYSRDLGFYGLAQASDSSVSIFRLTSR